LANFKTLIAEVFVRFSLCFLSGTLMNGTWTLADDGEGSGFRLENKLKSCYVNVILYYLYIHTPVDK